MMEPTYDHLQCRVERGVLVLTLLEAELRTDALVDAVRDELFEAVGRHATGKVVLDLQRVRYLASAGFQPLLTLHRKLQQEGSRMVLCGLSPVLSEVFRVTKLLRGGGAVAAPFESELDVAAAVERLAPSRAANAGGAPA
jgi:anti-anti-sigma factor